MSDGVLAERVGRGDLLLLRGATNRVGVLWEQDAGHGFKPMDLTDWDCRFEMDGPDGSTWYTRPCDAAGPDGEACVYMPPQAFNADIWRARTSGSWRMTAAKDDVTEMLGCGYWTMTK